MKPNAYQLSTLGLATAISQIVVWGVESFGGDIPTQIAAAITTLLYFLLAVTVGQIGVDEE